VSKRAVDRITLSVKKSEAQSNSAFVMDELALFSLVTFTIPVSQFSWELFLSKLKLWEV